MVGDFDVLVTVCFQDVAALLVDDQATSHVPVCLCEERERKKMRKNRLI